jgi:hypothetical protein
MARTDFHACVIDLAARRAKRDAQRSGPKAHRYLLWYPGFGFVARETTRAERPGKPDRLRMR